MFWGLQHISLILHSLIIINIVPFIKYKYLEMVSFHLPCPNFYTLVVMCIIYSYHINSKIYFTSTYVRWKNYFLKKFSIGLIVGDKPTDVLKFQYFCSLGISSISVITLGNMRNKAWTTENHLSMRFQKIIFHFILHVLRWNIF